MIKAPEVNGCPAAQSMQWSLLNIAGTASKDCFTAEFIDNLVV
jgi:hypothetical protein